MKKTIIQHIQTYVIRGFLTLIPIAVTFFVLRFLYLTIDLKIMRLVHEHLGFEIPGLGILILILILYFVGVITSNVIGRTIFHWIDHISHRIPIVKTIYRVGKQLSSTLSLPEKKIFKRSVLVRDPSNHIWICAFVVGDLRDAQNPNEVWLKVFIPTPPNPASGYIIFIRESETRDPGWSIEEVLKMVMSNGILGPDEIQ